MCSIYDKHVRYIAGAILLLISSSTFAEIDYHMGLEIGAADIDVSPNAFNDGSLGSTAKTDGNIFSWGVYGEIRFNQFMRMELGLLDGGFGTMDASSTGGSFWWPGQVSAEYGLGGIKLGAVGTMPIGSNDKFRLLAKAGLINWVSIVTLEDDFGSVTEADSGISTYMGFGAEYDMTQLLSIRVQHEVFSASADSDYFANDYDFDYARSTVGVLFRF